jgi:hypothetical protein
MQFIIEDAEEVMVFDTDRDVGKDEFFDELRDLILRNEKLILEVHNNTNGLRVRCL